MSTANESAVSVISSRVNVMTTALLCGTIVSGAQPGSCKFPDNLLGCENAAEFGNVKFLSDDIKLECEGTRSGKICASEGSFAGSRGGSVFGL